MIIADAALVGAVAAVVAAGAAVASLFAFKRFRPELRATIDSRRQAIRLEVVSKGRATGWIKDVYAMDSKMHVLSVGFAGLAGEAFKAAEIPTNSSWELILAALPTIGAFPPGTRVRVVWGRGKKRDLVPAEVDVSYFGLNSRWP